jgi:hypothetical protein
VRGFGEYGPKTEHSAIVLEWVKAWAKYAAKASLRLSFLDGREK